MKIKYKKWDCETMWGQYEGGITALQLVDADTGQMIATATVNLWDPHPPSTIWNNDTQIWVKDYSENQGMYQALMDAKILEPTFEPMKWPCGYTHALLGTLTPAALAELQAEKAGG